MSCSPIKPVVTASKQCLTILSMSKNKHVLLVGFDFSTIGYRTPPELVFLNERYVRGPQVIDPKGYDQSEFYAHRFYYRHDFADVESVTTSGNIYVLRHEASDDADPWLTQDRCLSLACIHPEQCQFRNPELTS